MSKLNIDQSSVKKLFTDKKSDFLIPDYQRPYAWGELECSTLWDDIFSFAFPENNIDNFNQDDEYFLGPIVTFENEGKKEIIDGQQRLTTLLLLLRAFYTKLGNMQDASSKKMRENIERCIWKTDEFDQSILTDLKIDSEVATDNDKEEFLQILLSGTVEKKNKSKYAENYKYFQNKIDEFLNLYPSYFPYLPARILNNCILLPIEADSQDTALRIFSTLNDRGKPLSDADIFKAQFYKFYKEIGKKDEFIKKWKELEELCAKIFNPNSGTPMDELFTRYMYYERAKMGIKSSTTEALRKFYDKDEYKLLKREETFNNLIILAEFWNDISNQDSERFNDEVLRKLYILNYAPNGMWTYFLSVYYMQNKDANNDIDNKKLLGFLNKTIAFVWTYAITNSGVNALRIPIYNEMINIVNDQPITFNDYKFDSESVRNAFNLYTFTNGRPITKSLLVWWAYSFDEQELLLLETPIEIEHIYAKKRFEMENNLINSDNIESLGNKAILEKKVNIRASDYRFVDKVKYYKGFTNNKGKIKEGTKNKELLTFAQNKTDYLEKDIETRKKTIINSFIEYLSENELIK